MSLTAEQLAARARGLGGSDAAAALGLSPWKTAVELYEEKRAALAGTQVKLEPSEPMRWGHLLEPVIRQEYAECTGRVVRVPTGTLVHPQHKFMVANVDGVTAAGEAITIDPRVRIAVMIRIGIGKEVPVDGLLYLAPSNNRNRRPMLRTASTAIVRSSVVVR